MASSKKKSICGYPKVIGQPEKLLDSENVSMDSNNQPVSGTHASLRYFGKLDLIYHTSTPVYSFTNLNQPSFQYMWTTSQLSARVLPLSLKSSNNSTRNLTARISAMQNTYWVSNSPTLRLELVYPSMATLKRSYYDLECLTPNLSLHHLT